MEGVGLTVKNGGYRIKSRMKDVGWVSEILLRVQSYSLGDKGLHAIFQNPRTTSSGRKVKLNPKYIIVGGGIRKLSKGSILFFW